MGKEEKENETIEVIEEPQKEVKEPVKDKKNNNVEEFLHSKVFLCICTFFIGLILMFVIMKINGKTTVVQNVKNKNIKITRIATGIPIGTDIDYIDAMTLEFALEGRKDI